jgi:hypothetical protein
MEQLLLNLVKKAKENKKVLLLLKKAAIICYEYELAAKLRKIEVTNFPEKKNKKTILSYLLNQIKSWNKTTKG